MKSILVGALACLAAGCASAPVAPAGGSGAMEAAATEVAAAGPVASVTADDDKRVCRKLPVMGSIMTKRVCATPSEWAETDAKALAEQEEFDRQRRGAGGTSGFE